MQKKSIKIWMKILISKKFSNFIQTLTFFDKVSGINMMKFQQNRTTFYKINFCSEYGSTNNSYTFENIV